MVAYEDIVLEFFQNRNAQYVEPDIVLPADRFLDVYGEDLRNRTFMIDSGKDAAFCLRPDFTVPIALMHLEWQQQAFETHKSYCYAGPVFRRGQQATSRPRQVMQSGIEVYQSGIESDAFVLESCLMALNRLGIRKFHVRIGDLSILRAILEGLEMPESWRQRLCRHVWRPAYFRHFLNEYGALDSRESDDKIAFLRSFAGLDAPIAQQAVRHILSLSNTPHQGSRSLEDIAKRFMMLSQETRYRPLNQQSINLIKKVIGLRCPADEAADKISNMTRPLGIDIRDVLENFVKRLEYMPCTCEFDAGFGRNLEYYDGFVFEVDVDGMPVAGGGRYDRLFSILGSHTTQYGAGGALRLSDIAQQELADD